VRRLGRALAGTPLRLRLVGAVLLLVAVALIGSGAVAAATMRNYLVSRVDEQLAGVAGHADNLFQDPDGDHGPGGPDGGSDGRLPSVYVSEVLGPTGRPIAAVDSNLIDTQEPLPALPRITAAQIRRQGEHYFTVPAVSGDHTWRVYAEPVLLTSGHTGTVLVAQSLADVNNTLGHLDELLAVIGAIAVLVVGGVGYLIVRASLRPLRVVEHTAAEIAAGDLSRRVPQSDPRTEVGHLASAVNTMLGEIETAFAQRAASEQRMRRFVADASHELRTPLTTVRGFAELYRKGAVPEGEETQRLLARIEAEAQRMGVLVEDLLLLARLDQERPMASEPVDLLALAGDTVHAAQALSPDRAVRLQIGNTDPPPIVLGDDARLRQVLTNLVTNAVKYSPAGSPVTVTVETSTADPAHPVVRVTVADQGPGLEPDAAARIFERFYRADAARNRNDGGSGLGLAIVAAIATGHGGRVSVDTAPGEGARFVVELPASPV
jgi:two-component system OmpR family sensor kinase